MNNKINNVKKMLALAFENHKKNNIELAESLYNKILKLDADHVDTNYLLGTLLLQKKNYEKAVKLLNNVLKFNPSHVHSIHNLGFANIEMGKLNEAKFFLDKVIKIDPNHAEAYYNLGNIYKNLDDLDSAESSYKKCIEKQPNHAKAYNNLGNILKDQGKLDEAIKAYTKTINIQFNHARAYHNLGNTYKQVGDFTKAKRCYENSYKYDPLNLETLFTLSELDNKILDLNLKKKINKILESKKISKKDYAYGNFIFAKYAREQRNFESEFNYLLKAHEYYFNSKKVIFNKGVNYWLNEVEHNEELKKFDNLNNKKEENEENIRPIFIVGTPRCGSTLIEKVIASGKIRFPMGEETAVISKIMGQKILGKENFYSDKKKLKKEIISLYKKKELINKKYNFIFTDKSLDNFFFISLIKYIFPLAKVIHCKRNFVSSITSIIKNNLGDVSWAHNPEHIFKFYDIYKKRIDYFSKIYPKFIYEIQLEDFVNNPEVESKKIMNFCDLPWDKECLEFYKRKDLTSRTASNIQIRKGIYSNNPASNEPYRELLSVYGNKYNWFN